MAHIKTLHERKKGDADNSRSESWSLVQINGERLVLFEVHEGELPENELHDESRLMTVREALKEARPIARSIWLALED